MSILHTDFLNLVTNQLAKAIQLSEDTLIISQLEDIMHGEGARIAKERNGMSPSIYYLYLYILKWGYTVAEVGDLPGAYLVKVDAGPNGKTRTITLEKHKD